MTGKEMYLIFKDGHPNHLLQPTWSSISGPTQEAWDNLAGNVCLANKENHLAFQQSRARVRHKEDV